MENNAAESGRELYLGDNFQSAKDKPAIPTAGEARATPHVGTNRYTNYEHCIWWVDTSN